MKKNLQLKDTWLVLNNMLLKEGVAKQHLNSYNQFIEEGLQKIINETQNIDVETLNPYKVRLGKIKLGTPRVVEIDGSVNTLMPLEARLRNLTYSAPITLEMSVEENGSIRESQIYSIGDMPVMVKSNQCSLSTLEEDQLIASGDDTNDPGGYFIIHGSDRVIVGLEDLSPNRIMVEKEKVGNVLVHKSKIYSSIVGYRAKIELYLKQDGDIFVKIPNSPVDLPIITVMRALGLEKDKDIADSISLKPGVQDLLEISFETGSETATTIDALNYIGNRIAHGMIQEYRIKKAEILLDWALLPHLGKDPAERYNKAMFIGEAVLKLLELKLDWIDPEDKDNYGNKIIKFAGELIADLFRTAFRNLIRDMKYQLERMGTKRGTGVIGVAIRPGIITDKLNNAIATGNWGKGKVGVTQLLDRTNYLSTISHLRRVQSPLSRSQPNFEARDLHATHFGRICPSETPEGANCGLVKNLALSAYISVNSSNEGLVNHLYDSGLIKLSECDDLVKYKGARVFLDGKFLGYCQNEVDFLIAFKELRRKSEIHPHTSIALFNPKSDNAVKRINIYTSPGRVLRPLVILNAGKPSLTQATVDKIGQGSLPWDFAVASGQIELVDANEEDNCYVALFSKSVTKLHTHLELYPASMLGVAASIIPYPEHNQSPRNTYESAMAKQSLGFTTPTYLFNTYVRQHLLLYPETPLVTTRTTSILNIDKRPSGQNCIVAVLSYEGYNIEDAIILNKSSLERGLMRSMFYRLYDGDSKQYLGGMKDKFEIPNPDDNIRGYRGEKFYRLLEEDGIISAESKVTGGDVIIGRSSPPRFIEEYKEFEVKGPYRRDTSVSIRPSESGVVDNVFLTQNKEGERMYKIRVRDMRIPEIGDKYASRHGQKGIVGLVVKSEDMPYSSEGVIPDIIINPHAFPSRMTVGQFLESISGKVAAFSGNHVDGTPFNNIDKQSIGDILTQYGFQSNGKEVLYDGKTGKKFKTDVFMGVVFYQKLHHMVADKIHARARGQVQMLTKQPTEGRARGGGLRFGEMERDCLISYGASMVLKDRLLDESDKTELHVCEKCGLVAYHDLMQRKYICRLCGDTSKISIIVVAYAFKLLIQEMLSLNIAARIQIKDKV